MASNDDHFDVAIVGSGIVGLAHAWTALESGNRVVLFERDPRALGASIRNFGMVWPIGQPAGHLRLLAMRSRERWLLLREQAGIWVNECGSLHLLRHEDEVAVCEEFLARESEVSTIGMLTVEQAAEKSPAVRTEGLLAGLWSANELCVNPPQAMLALGKWLAQQPNLSLKFGTTVTNITAANELSCSNGKKFRADRVVVCSGHDFETLFPLAFQESGIKKCKLQMMSTVKQDANWALGPHMAGGLSLRHYGAFKDCPTLVKLRNRVAAEQPELDEFGVHVMASMNDCGEVILGDSHVYDADITPFDSQQIDALILQEIGKLISIPNMEISRRWHGIYAKHSDDHVASLQPHDNCKIVTATGGAGMTLSFGIAEQTWQNWS